MTEQDLLSKIHSDLGSLCGRLDGFCERLERHDEAIFGNGQPGLAVRLDRAEQDIGTAKSGVKWALGSVVSIVCAGVSALVAWAKNQ